mmetsp:Transcript_47137/g.109379  ORF Transcript_47137/g.109379 Transcript_47137/m.109379 type:complete len:259 (-) Transcript_47137:657-1433(-)
MLHVLRSHERHRNALGTGAPCTTDPVDVVLCLWGELIVDHHADVLDIEAARSNVGSNEDGRAPAAELAEHPLALALLLVAVDRVAPDLPRESPLQLVAHSLRRAEDEDARRTWQRVDLLNEMLVPLLGRRNEDDALLDVLVSSQLLVSSANGHLAGVALELRRQPPHLFGPCRRVHQRLVARRYPCHDFADLRLETHIEHAVCLVHHHKRHLLQADLPSFQKVVQATGCHDDEVDALPYCGELLALGSASVQAHGAHP